MDIEKITVAEPGLAVASQHCIAPTGVALAEFLVSDKDVAEWKQIANDKPNVD